jgi:tRNA modification GTPase
MHGDTIAAIATPLVPAAIGIVRVSGPDVDAVARQFFGTTVAHLTPRMMYTKAITSATNRLIDTCCVVYFKGPHSYTGEDTLELYAHGSPHILRLIITEICAMPNCRLAKNGEFTKRAFLNGKMALPTAESVAAIINATNDRALDIALSQYKGHIYATLTAIRHDLEGCLARIEAAVEFPDDVTDIPSLLPDLSRINNQLHHIIAASDYGRYSHNGITYLIVGAPNVGKSSLFNQLCGEDRSIVTQTAGTTRDYIDITITYNGYALRIVDTAGYRNTTDPIEERGIQKIHELATTVDAYIHVLDATVPPSPLPPNLPAKPVITVINKIDAVKTPPPLNACPVSCITPSGITELKNALLAPFDQSNDVDTTSVLSNLRQLSLVTTCHNHLTRACQSLADHPLDIISIDIRDALNALSDVLGDSITESLLDRIFSEFCIGK